MPDKEIRHLDITDLERIERFKRAGYGGAVSDALYKLGITDTVFSDRFKPLNADDVLCGRALPVKLHSLVMDAKTIEEHQAFDKEMDKKFGVHPQKHMMRMVDQSPDGCILCFDCGGDMQPAHFGEMSCQLAYSHGCRGMLIAGNCRDTRYVKKMKEFPVFSFGTRPNAFGGWIITDVNVPIQMPGHLTHYVKVRPGDFIFGDSDGVQLIPKDYVDEVLLHVEKIYEKENEQREQLAKGEPIDEVYKRYGVL